MEVGLAGRAGVSRVTVAAALAVVLAVPLFCKDPFFLHVCVMTFLYTSLGVSWNLIGGFAGQVSLGHAVFFGIGAYSSSLLLMRGGVSPWAGMVLGAALAAGVACLIGWVCFRLKGHYFVIATLVIAEVAQTIVLNSQSLGGAYGLWLPVVSDSWALLQFRTSKAPYYYLTLSLVGAGLGISSLLARSKLGYYLRAIKSDPDASSVLGVNLWQCKLFALMLSAALAAVSGSVYAQYVLLVDPFVVLHFRTSLTAALIAILGGAGSVWGPVLGGLVLTPLSEYTRAWLSGGGRAVDLMVYGALVMAISVIEPRGLVAVIARATGAAGKRAGVSAAGGGEA